MLDFRSDNTDHVSDQIIKSLIDVNFGNVSSYGDDEYTKNFAEKMNEVFERDVDVYPVFTGTAANVISFAGVVPPYGAIFCAENSHLDVDECNAPEFFTGGAKIIKVDSIDGKINLIDLNKKIKNLAPHSFHNPLPSLISLTQSTELGTVYGLNEIREISKIAKNYNMTLHIDGARISNALAYLKCSWADISWKSGVDILSLGTTKNGTIAAEAIISFKKDLSNKLMYYRKRGGHLVSKMRFLSSQLNAFFLNDLWKSNALHANKMALKLAEGLAQIDKIEIAYPVQSNGVFPIFPKEIAESLINKGYLFYQWGDPNNNTYRLMTTFNTSEKAVKDFIDNARIAAEK